MIRQPDGRWVKENPEITTKIESTIGVYKKAIERSAILSTLIGHPGWECFQEIIKERLQAIANKLNDFKKQEERTVYVLLQEKTDFEAMLNIVSDFEASRSGFESALARSEKELETRRGSAVS